MLRQITQAALRPLLQQVRSNGGSAGGNRLLLGSLCVWFCALCLTPRCLHIPSCTGCGAPGCCQPRLLSGRHQRRHRWHD